MFPSSSSTLAVNEFGEIVCVACDVRLRYERASCLSDHLGVKRVRCLRCTFVNKFDAKAADDDAEYASRVRREAEEEKKKKKEKKTDSRVRNRFVPFFSLNDIMFKRNNDTAPPCAKCTRRVSEVSDGLTTMKRASYNYYKTSEYWNEFLCERCYSEPNSVIRCDGCAKVESERDRAMNCAFAKLPDEKRFLCLPCSASVVVDNEDAAILYEEIKQFMQYELGLEMPEGQNMPPLHVVTEESLKLSMQQDQNSTAHVVEEDDGSGKQNKGVYSRTRGLCLSTEQTLTRVIRRPNGFSWSQGITFQEETLRLSTSNKVTAIVVVNCLPRLLFGSILAHEMTHLHFRLAEGYPRKLDRKLEEGLCQLVALLWTEREASKIENDSDQLSLAGSICHQIRTDPSDIYGNGLRVALSRFQKFGILALFENVKLNASLPE